MNYKFARHIEYLISFLGVRPRLPSIFAEINMARRAVNFFGYRAEFERNFEQNKRFLRALPAGFYWPLPLL